jgi:hypothetical protein
MRSTMSGYLLMVGLVLMACYPVHALELTDSPKVHTVSSNTTLTHVFYCSLEDWEEHNHRQVMVSTASPSVVNISPRSFNLSKGFTIPVTIYFRADENDPVIPIVFTVLPTRDQTIGLIEIQYRKELPVPTPTLFPTSIPTMTPTVKPAPLSNAPSGGTLIPWPFSIAFSLKDMRILGPFFQAFTAFI